MLDEGSAHEMLKNFPTAHEHDWVLAYTLA